MKSWFKSHAVAIGICPSLLIWRGQFVTWPMSALRPVGHRWCWQEERVLYENTELATCLQPLSVSMVRLYCCPRRAVFHLLPHDDVCVCHVQREIAAFLYSDDLDIGFREGWHFRPNGQITSVPDSPVYSPKPTCVSTLLTLNLFEHLAKNLYVQRTRHTTPK